MKSRGEERRGILTFKIKDRSSKSRKGGKRKLGDVSPSEGGAGNGACAASGYLVVHISFRQEHAGARVPAGPPAGT